MSILIAVYLIIHFLNVLLGLLLCMKFFSKYQEYKLNILLIILAAAFFWIVANLLFVFSYYHDLLFFDVFAIVFQLISATFLVVFSDMFEGEISIHKTLIPSVITSMVFGFGWFCVSSNDRSLMMISYDVDKITAYNLTPLIGIIVLITTFLIGYWIYQELSQSEEYVLSMVQLSQIKVMKIGIILTFFIASLFDVFGSVFVSDFSNEVMGLILGQLLPYTIGGIGILLIGYSYLQYDGIAILQPQEIKSVMVIDETGIPLFKKDFLPLKIQSELISGAITAISMIMQEAFEIRSNLTGVSFQSDEILVEISNKNAFILFVGRKSRFLKSSLKKFAELFNESYKSHITNFVGDVSPFENALNEFKVAFGYGNLELDRNRSS